MRNPKAISILTAIVMAAAGSSMSVMAAETTAATQAADQPAAETQTEAPVTAAKILGIWEGTYDGKDAGKSGIVKRQIIFNVDQCTEDGSFSGIAEVPSTPGERYIFAGTCDFNTGDVTIQGNKWIVDYNSWNFLRFKGKLDTENMQITGDVGTAGTQFFEYKKTSDEYIDYSIDLNAVP